MLVIGKSVYLNNFNGYEFNADIDFYKYHFTVDIGGWSRTAFPKGDGFYSNSGEYFRLGVDYNFLYNDPQRNMLLIGVRYGRAYFDETLNINSLDPLWGDFDLSLNNQAVRGRWLELSAGLRARILKYFLLGYTARFKFAPNTKGHGELIPYDIPGYGLKEQNIYWGFNYQLFFEIPFKPAPK